VQRLLSALLVRSSSSLRSALQRLRVYEHEYGLTDSNLR
jgi:hypothetical protein